MALNLFTGVDTLINGGTISNYVDFGDGNDTYTYGNIAPNDGTITGYLKMDVGDDILTISKSFSPTIKRNFALTDEAITLGYGADTLNISSGATVTGSVVGTGYGGIDDSNDLLDGADIFNLDGSVVGNVGLGGGNDTLNFASTGSISGYMNFGSGVEVFDYSNSVGTINGYINM